ncbi:MAG: ROK family protein [Saprospiraceae bacterium]|nr:ROK family protein [Saprospiraceae bacterium]
MKLALGIDIGGTSTKLALIDPQGNITARSSFSTADRTDEHDFFEHLFTTTDALLGGVGASQLAGIAAGAPSANEQKGTIENAANLPFAPVVEFVKTVQERYGVPTSLVKDSNASILGEWHYGAAKGMKNFLLLTLGTGLGAGIVANGQLLGGEFGHGGEAGHICVEPGGRACGCGRFGCTETYVSATGLKRTVFALMANTMTHSTLRSESYDSMTARHIFEAAQAGDALALAAFGQTGEVLGRAIADMAAWFEPEAVVLSGGLAMAGDLLFVPTIESFENHSLAFHKGHKIKVLPSALGENDAALLGAGALVWKSPPTS